MKKISVKHTFIMLQLLLLFVFSIILSSTPVSFQNFNGTNKEFNIKLSTANFSNISVLSDGFSGIYWNDATSFSPAIAVDSSDAVHVVWDDHTDGIWGVDREIMYAKYTNATGWSNATVISDGFNGIYWNDGTSSSPAIAVDSSDAVHVVWYDTTNGIWGTDLEVMYVKYTTTTGWSNATVISDGFNGIYWNDGTSFRPAIGIDSSDAVHVVWSDYTDGIWGTDIEIMYVKYTTTTGWSNATVISDGFNGIYWNDGNSYYPAIAVDSSDVVHVVWSDSTDGVWGVDTEVMYVKYTTATGWSNTTVISDGFSGIYWNDGNSNFPAIAVDNSDVVHVVWEDHTDGVWGTDGEIMYAKYTTATDWSNATVISDGINDTYWNDDNSYDPAIAVDNSDVVHVVWEDHTDGVWGTDREIMYAEYTSPLGWSTSKVISDGYGGVYWNDGDSFNPAIAVGIVKVHIVWDDDTNGMWGTDNEIFFTSRSIPATLALSSTTIPGYNIFLVVFGVCAVTYLFIRRKQKKIK
ncbi:hypothetical protein LCGC14_2027980 [marine sediment metagenome]|uniref:Uncharacterized protein n=1 Tax=marine sediment metagenome TaxID=412755 RepID=A0A0F9EVE3_9ZZZZ